MKESRLRSVFAYVVMFMLLAQSFTPIISAQSALSSHEPTSETTTMTEATPGQDVAETESSEPTAPADSESDENASDPNESTGDSSGAEGEDADNDADTSEGDAESEGVVVDDIVSADALVPAAEESLVLPRATGPFGVTSVDVNPKVLANAGDKVQATGTWAIPDDATGGYTFTLTIPSQLNVAPGAFDLCAPGVSSCGDGSAIGQMFISGTTATFVMNDKINNEVNVSGTFFMWSSADWGLAHAGTTVTLPFTADNEMSWNPTVQVPDLPLPPAKVNPTKTGVINGDVITWTVYFPEGPAKTATIEDADGADWAYIPGSFTAITAGGATPVVTENADGSITVVVSEYSAGAKPGFTFQSLVDEDFRGTLAPGVSHTFSNTITGKITGLNGVEATLTPVTATVTKTGGLVPGTNPEKSARWAYADQGTIVTDGAIIWTVYFPKGASNGATITDVVPAGAGWEFDCSSFYPQNTWIATATVAEGDCTPTSLKVTVPAYSNQHNAPGFSISANITDTSLTQFGNLAKSENTHNNGVNKGEDDATTPPRTDVPEAGTKDPVKTGAWNRGDQGRDNPAGSIKWTFYFPAGSSGGATLEDIETSTNGWTFDCDSFTPINTQQTTATKVECEDGTLKVTVGSYIEPNTPPGFTINATLADGYEDIVDVDENGKLVFPNTATVVNTTLEGTTLPEQTITGEVKQDPPPPAPEPGTNPVKSGDWIDKVRQNEITWTIWAPSGPASEVVLTDIAGSNWEFVCDTEDLQKSITSLRDWAGTPTVVECSPDKLVVKFGEYTGTDQYNVPGFTVKAKATTSFVNGQGFINEVTSVAKSQNGLITKTGTTESNWLIQNSNAGGEGGGTNYAIPLTPTVAGAVCEDGNEPAPRVVLPTNGSGITYITVQDVDADSKFIVKATKQSDYTWGFPRDGWVAGENDNELIYKGSVTIVPCEVPVVLVVPVAPHVTGAVCENGIDPTPEIVYGDGPDGVSYTTVSEINSATGDYVVKATITGENMAWGYLTGTGWTAVEGNANEAIFNGHVDIVPCEQVTLVTPTVEAAVCEGGVEPAPVVVGVEDTDDIDYTASAVDADGNYTVTAELKDTNKVWPTSLPTGWALVEGVMTYTGQVEIVPCDVVALVLPTVDAAVCEGGVDPDPTTKTVNLPPDSDVVSYAVTSEINAAGEYIVTATKHVDAQWPTELGQWVPVEGNANAVTYTGQVEIVPCEPIMPILPEVVGNVCQGGEYTPPTVDFGVENTDIQYANGVAQGGQITADAQLTREGTSWGDLTGTGWTVDPTDATRATFVGSYVEAPCAPIVPANPIVKDAVCTGGELIDPTVIITDTERISYTKEGAEVSGGSVIVTATLADGFEWDEEMPKGWSVNPENPAEATFIVELADVQCEPVVPVAPTVTPAVCELGEATDPSVTTPTTDGITYTKEGAEVPGGKVIVTATLGEGKEWGDLPTGWTKTSPTTATYEVTLNDYPCEPVVPVAPTVTPAVCDTVTVVNPVVTTPVTPGITYTREGAEVPGGKVIVTATLEDGKEWGDLPTGWIKTSPTTAQYVVVINDIDCTITLIPGVPTVGQTVCEEGKIVPPSVTVPTTPGIIYTTNGEEVPGGTVVITATIALGYAWGELPTGWTLVSPTEATFTVTFADLVCDVGTPTPPVDPVTELPSTGTGSSTFANGGVLVLMVGLVLAAGLRFMGVKRA